MLTESKAMGVEVLPPDVNEGQTTFWPVQQGPAGPGTGGGATDAGATCQPRAPINAWTCSATRAAESP